MACIWYPFPYYYFHSICLPRVWVGNGVVTLLFHFITCARLPVWVLKHFSGVKGSLFLFLLQNFYLLVFVWLHVAIFLSASIMRLLFLSNGTKKRKGKEEEPSFLLVWAAFVQNLLLIGFANWRSWIIQGIIWNWFCYRSSALCAFILFCVLLDCVTTLYKVLFDNMIFLSFLMILLGVTNFIEVDGDRNQEERLGCTCSKVPPTLSLLFYQNENITKCVCNLGQCIQNLKVPFIFVVRAI